MNYNIKKIENKAQIAHVMKIFNTLYPRSLDSLVENLDSYAEKISKKGIVLIAEYSEQVLGYIVFYMNDEINKKGYISQIAVNQKYRGLGIGKKLIDQCLGVAEEKKFLKVMLEVDKVNESAIKFYEKLDFHIIAEATDVSWYMTKVL